MGGFLKKALPYAAGALAGGVMGSFAKTAPYAAAGSAAAGALANKKNRAAGALQGFAGGGVGSAIGGGLQSKTGFGGGAMQGLKSFGNSIPGFGGVGTSNPTGMFAKFFTPQSIQNPNTLSVFNKGASSAMASNTAPGMSATGNRASFVDAPWQPSIKAPTFSSPAAAGTPTGVLSQAGSTATGLPKKNLIDSIFAGGQQGGGKPGGTNWMGAAAGAALPMVVGAMTPDVKAPDLSSISNPLREQVNTTYANSPAKAFYSQQINNPIGVDSTNGLAVAKLAHDKQLDANLRSFDQQWKASMGGQDMTNNSEYQNQRQKMIQDAEANWTAQQAQMQFQYDQAQQAQKYAAAAALQGMDDAQLNALAGLAQYDLTTIMAQFQMDATSAQQIQELAATASSLIMQKSLGLTGAAAPAKAA